MVDPAGPSTNASERTGVRVVAGPLSLTVLLQSLTAFGLHSASVYAPIAAPALGLPPERVSIFVMFAYGAASLVGLGCSGLIARLGPLRTVQIALLAPALGLLCAAVGWWPLLVVAAVLIGSGNGFTGPVSSYILVERTPRAVLSLVLSIKQTGVPVGGGIAGALIPLMALTVGWRESLGLAAMVYLVCLIALQPLRNQYDQQRDRTVRIGVTDTVRQMKSALKLTWEHPRLRVLSLACFAYVAVQWVVLTFMVSLLHTRLGYSLVTAGLVFSATQLTGIPGRLLWGVLGDRVRSPMALLGWLGLVMGVLAAIIGSWSTSWSLEWILLVSVLFGITGVSWNGLFFAEVARNVRFEDVSRATGGGQFIGFLGGMLGPVVFDAIATVSSSYQAAYTAIAVLPFVAGLTLLKRSRAVRPSHI
ncbi:MAG: MFS transporter [Betaproteobacteria bacterium]|nr:MFS transporter [Betaproteobacteria bacterium]